MTLADIVRLVHRHCSVRNVRPVQYSRGILIVYVLPRRDGVCAVTDVLREYLPSEIAFEVFEES